MAAALIVFWGLGVFTGYCIGWGKARNHYAPVTNGDRA